MAQINLKYFDDLYAEVGNLDLEEGHREEIWIKREAFVSGLINSYPAISEELKTLRDKNKENLGKEIKLTSTLQKIQKWDMLNPADPEKLSDAPWLKKLVDEALQN